MQFKALKPTDENYTEEWKKLLRKQAVHESNDSEINQDVLPIPQFEEDDDLYKAEWKIECFM